MTQLGDKMEAAGISRRGAELGMSVMRYFRAGGSLEEAIAVVNAAAVKMKLPGAGHCDFAEEADKPMPASRQPNGDAGGHQGCAQEAMRSLPSASPPVPNKPRGLRAIAGIQHTIAQGYLIMMKTSDGRSWGEVGWHELSGMHRDGRIASMILRLVNPPMNYTAKLNEVLSDRQFREIHDAAQALITAEA